MDNYLEHHGILGQKWGVRNGPPYPLKSGQHSSAEKKAGWKKSLSGGTETKKKYHTKPFVDTVNQRYTERGEELMSKKGPKVIRSLKGSGQGGVYTEDGERISRKEYRAIRKDLKNTNKEEFENLRGFERGRQAMANAVENRVLNPLSSALVELIYSKNEGMTLQQYREGQDSALLATEDMINKIIAEHGNEMASRFIEDVAGGLKFRKGKNGGGIFEVAPRQSYPPASTLSDQELIDFNKRRGLETQYKKYTRDTTVSDQMNALTQLANTSKNAVNNANQLVNEHYNNERKKRRDGMDLSSFTDEDLRKVVNRLSLERQYKDLNAPGETEKERKVKTALGIVGTVINSAAAATIIYASIRSALSKG